MAVVIKYVKIIRNNWKKSTVAALALSYGYKYMKNRFDTEELMRVYCQKASEYGRQTIPMEKNPKIITVILNPNANKRKATDEFEKYCAPILNLSGVCVEVIKTESEGHAKKLMEDLSSTDAIVVAGGDGTLSEVVTGLLRRTDENTSGLVPLGVLPLGRSNTVAKSLFPGGNHLEHVRSLADASLAVVEEVTKPVDIMRIEVTEEENEEDLKKTNKPVYALSGLKWGAYRDAELKKDSYWVFGSLRNYVTYLFNGYKSNLTWNCEAKINYSPPCEGCSNCAVVKEDQTKKKWYQRLINNQHKNAYAAVTNPECNIFYETEVHTADLTLQTSNIIPERSESKTIPSLKLNIGPKSIDYFNFVKQGWQYENGETRDVQEVIEARQIEIKPKKVSADGNDIWFSIDNENFEVKPVTITLLPKIINMFCKKDDIA